MKNTLLEANNSGLNRAAKIITQYLQKKVNQKFFQFPGIEQYKNSTGVGFGLRFYSKTGKSIRFNYDSKSGVGNLSALKSFTYWAGYQTNPKQIDFAQRVSLAQILPLIADILSFGLSAETVYSYPAGIPLTESLEKSGNTLVEARQPAADPVQVYMDVLAMVQRPGFKKGLIYNKYKGLGFKIFDAIADEFQDAIVKSGTSYSWEGNKKDAAAIIEAKDRILESIGCITAAVNSVKSEVYAVDKKTADLNDELERLTFEDQLKDLVNLLKMSIKGNAANAVFVAGRGGTGKTHTVEETLEGMGLRDGEGYFKNTGSISTAGLYSLLFRHQNDVILFDDCDDVFKDQSSRNLLKAATDTKKRRKLVWSKQGSNVVDPDEDMTPEEMLEQGKIPRYFDFEGKIVFISNLPKEKLDPDGAIATRAMLIDINPTEDEIYDFMSKICGNIDLEGLELSLDKRKQIVEIMRTGASKQSANLRKLSRGLKLYAGAEAAGTELSEADLRRMISHYA